MDIVTMVVDVIKFKFNLQKWINSRYQDPEKVVIEKKVLDHIVTPEGLKFYLDTEGSIISQVLREYSFAELRPDDVVLDLGANIGAFSLRAAQKCRHVYAVEPLYTDELKTHINLNNLQEKITVIPYGIGNGDMISISYRKKQKVVKTYPLSEILKMTGPVSFLKCDIEGAEWSILPDNLRGIRRIEIEVHQGRDSCMPENPLLLEFIQQNWRIEKSNKDWPRKGCYIHAFPKN
jgi:FkbM family methyltransferase